MVRGVNPLPTPLKLVRGDPKSKINDDEPIPEDGIPRCPVNDRMVNEVWDYTIDQLKKMRVVTMADRDVLLAYVQAVVMHRRASELIDKEGYFFQGTDALSVHPAVRMQRESALLMRQYASEFGLTPAARTRIKVGAAQVEQQEKNSPSRLLSS